MVKPPKSNRTGCMMVASDPDHFEQHEHGTDGDGRVGDVEGPEVRVAPVDVDEVYDVAGDGAVDQVAERTAQDERQPVARQLFVLPELPGVERDRDQRERGDG